MGFELWYSETTKHRRNGTSFLEMKQVFTDNISIKQIFEWLDKVAIDERPLEVKSYLVDRDFDLLGVVDYDGNMLGYVREVNLSDGELKDYLEQIDYNMLISNTTSFPKLLEVLTKYGFALVLNNNNIDGIVTKADINKPLFRLYLFGIVSLFEMHINFWINKYVTENLNKFISPDRFEAAEKILGLRQHSNDQLTILECLQLSDKRDILLLTPDFLTLFGFSKRSFEKFMKTVEIIRNEVAHSQYTITKSLDWNRLVDVIRSMELFLEKAEEELIK